MTPISPVAESEILLSSLHRQLKAVADHPEHYWIGQILLDTLKRETGYTADARPSDPAQEPEAVAWLRDISGTSSDWRSISLPHPYGGRWEVKGFVKLRCSFPLEQADPRSSTSFEGEK